MKLNICLNKAKKSNVMNHPMNPRALFSMTKYIYCIHNTITHRLSPSTGQLLPRPHQDHPVLPTGGVPADVHQWGPGVHHVQAQCPAHLRLPQRPAWTHGVLPQHANAKEQLNKSRALQCVSRGRGGGEEVYAAGKENVFISLVQWKPRLIHMNELCIKKGMVSWGLRYVCRINEVITHGHTWVTGYEWKWTKIDRVLEKNVVRRANSTEEMADFCMLVAGGVWRGESMGPFMSE